MLTSIAPCKGLRIPESRKILLMESGIQFKESGIHLTIGIQDPTDKHWNRVPGIRNTAQGILNPTKDWNPESRILLANTGKEYLESGIQL